MVTITTLAELQDQLVHYHGTQNYYRHGLTGMLYTDGVRAMAEAVNAYWLIDAIASHWRTNLAIRSEPFLVWFLDVQYLTGDGEQRACLRGFMDFDSDRTELENEVLYQCVRQEIAFTDFPPGRFKLYQENGVLLLPGEY